MEQFCGNIAQTCDECVEVSLVNSDTIDTGASIPLSVDYTYWIRDCHGNLFYDEGIIRPSEIILNTANFPVGLFNQYAGQLDFFITFWGDSSNTPQQFIYDGKHYFCMQITISC